MITVIPYIEIDGCRTIPDRQMVDMFKQMEADGNVTKVFFQGYPSSPYEFLRWAKISGNNIFVAFDGEKPIGLAWVNEVTGRRGVISFCSFSGVFPRKKIRAARRVLEVLFNYYEVLVAIIPSAYTDSRRFCKMVGFEEIGEIPHFSYFPNQEKNTGAWFQYMTKNLLEVQNG